VNNNLLNIVKRIVTEQGEDILNNPQRLKAFFMDYAKDEPKSERVAFGRCVEMGCYAELKGCGSVEERLFKKPKLTDQLHRTTGIDRVQCADAIDLLEAAVFGAVSMVEIEICKNCGKEQQAGWKSCPFCNTAVSGTHVAISNSQIPPSPSVVQPPPKPLYYVSYNYKETGPYDLSAIESMVANRQISRDYFVRQDNSQEWKPITSIVLFPPDRTAQMSVVEPIAELCGSPSSSVDEIKRMLVEYPPSHTPQKRKTVLRLCLFLGGLGVHRFYAGKIASGIIMLLFLLGGLMLAVGGVFDIAIIHFAVFVIWWIIDIVRICTGKFTDKLGYPFAKK